MKAVLALVFLVVWLTFMSLYILHKDQGGSGLGSVSGPDLSPTRNAAAVDETAAVPASLGAEARLSDRVAQPEERRIPNAEAEGSTPSSVALSRLLVDYDWGTDAEAIAWLTLDGWEQPEFLELTQDEAHELLALDDTMGLKGPGLMTAIAGPFPTREDCERAAASQTVQDALQAALAWNAFVVEFGSIPPAKQSAQWPRRLKDAVRAKDDAELELMAALEKATGHEWRLWWRLYRRWSE